MAVVHKLHPPVQASVNAAEMFDLAPISLWLEDFSAIKIMFNRWRAAGVTDLAEFLADDPERLRLCAQSISVLAVNQRTLDLFAAANLEEILEHQGVIFAGDMLNSFLQELDQLWRGQTAFTAKSVNYALDGRRVDIRIAGKILPGHETSWSRVVVALEDITAEEEANRRTIESEAFSRALFEQSPVSLWVHDISETAGLLDRLRNQGVGNLLAYFKQNPDYLQRCVQAIRVIDVNRQTLRLFAARDKETLIRRLDEVYRPETWPYFAEQFDRMWRGEVSQTCETVNYSLDGARLDLVMQLSVMPGHEADSSLVLAALTDITARKRDEASLAWLNKHDISTGLRNRSFYVEEIDRLGRDGPFPVGVIIADLNGLKRVNDTDGHEAGDMLINRASAILKSALPPAGSAARIGGDEFSILLPGADEAAVKAVLRRIQALIREDNRRHPGCRLSLSFGLATSPEPGPLEPITKQADLAMYEAKRAFYAAVPAMNRRR